MIYGNDPFPKYIYRLIIHGGVPIVTYIYIWCMLALVGPYILMDSAIQGVTGLRHQQHRWSSYELHIAPSILGKIPHPFLLIAPIKTVKI